MVEFLAIKVGDWIERDVALGYSSWAKVISVTEGECVSVVYLQDDDPVRDEMIFEAGNWDFRHKPPSGMRIHIPHEIKDWRNRLREGPPFQIGGGTTPLVYLHTKGTVWRRRRSAD